MTMVDKTKLLSECEERIAMANNMGEGQLALIWRGIYNLIDKEKTYSVPDEIVSRLGSN